MQNKKRWQLLLGVMAFVLFIAACEGDVDDSATPTPNEPTVAPSVTVTPTVDPSDVPEDAEPSTTPTTNLTPPSPTFPPTVTPPATATPAPPTPTPGPTNTPGPYEHRVRTGDDCIGIVYQYGHLDLDVLQSFYDINPNLRGGCNLPPEGATVLVPRPTTQSGGVVTSDILPTLDSTVIPYPEQGIFVPGEFCVELEDETLTSIALKNDTSPRRICELNPLPDGLDCRGCDFSQTDVGFCPNPPLIVIGQCYTIPGATPTPTNTPPPSGDETATPTPTLRAPNLVYPSPGLTVSGLVRLQWASSGVLKPDEYYVVNLTDETAGTFFIEATRATSLDVPAEFAPQDGQPHQIVWSVSIQRQTEDGLFVEIGGRSPDYNFTWE